MDKKDIENIARLARIEVPEDEKESLVKDIDSILSFVGQISDANIEADPESRVGVVKNVMREDGEPHESKAFTADLLKETPTSEGNYLKVKKIL
jgi:aspartyl-tRNA(Asn)/glutamyl-tRNA(Gln) amidotransferase subunit C